MIGILLAMSALVASAIAQAPICNHVECADYTLLEDFVTHQLRRYPTATYAMVEASVRGDRWRHTSMILYSKLIAYLHGSNDQGVNISMTAPVFSEFTPTTSLTSHNRMSIYMSLPADLQVDPPQPDADTGVLIVDIPEREYYVLSFGHYHGKLDLLSKIQDLENVIGNQQLYDRNFVVKAAYNLPGQETGSRQNEIWLMKF